MPVMSTTQHLSITLPGDLADKVRHEVASGRYASESDVLSEGVRALIAREEPIESWLRHEVMSAYRALQSDPGQVLTVEQVRHALSAKRGGETEHGD